MQGNRSNVLKRNPAKHNKNAKKQSRILFSYLLIGLDANGAVMG